MGKPVYFVKTRNVKTPSVATEGSAGIDFYLPDDRPFKIVKGINKIPLGIKIEIPEETVLFLKEKSGISINYGLQLVAGVVDCVPADTEISTVIGQKSIQEILDMDNLIEVYSYNTETREFEIDYIDDIWEVGTRKLLKIYFEDNTFLKCTPEHLILTDRGWKKAKDLNNGESIVAET